MQISKSDYLSYMALIERTILENKFSYNSKSHMEYTDRDEQLRHLKECSLELFKTWRGLNRPKEHTPDGFYCFFDVTKERYLENLAMVSYSEKEIMREEERCSKKRELN